MCRPDMTPKRQRRKPFRFVAGVMLAVLAGWWEGCPLQPQAEAWGYLLSPLRGDDSGCGSWKLPPCDGSLWLPWASASCQAPQAKAWGTMRPPLRGEVSVSGDRREPPAPGGQRVMSGLPG